MKLITTYKMTTKNEAANLCKHFILNTPYLAWAEETDNSYIVFVYKV